MADFIEQIIDEFGELSIIDRKEEIVPISTGSISLDCSIGIGGIPSGRITEIFGSEGVGKTTLALGIAREAMKQGFSVLYVDAESMLDFDLVESIVGKDFDRDKLVILNPASGNEAFKMIEIGLDSGEFKVIILDSIGAIAPEEEQNKEFDKASVGLVAKMVSKFLRRVNSKVKRSGTALIILNQVRDKIGSYMGGFDTPGGHALKHFTAVRVSLTKGKQIKSKDEIIGVDVNFTVRKNKMAPPFRSYHFPIIFGKGVDFATDLLDFAAMLGVIRKSGSYFKYGEVSLGQGRTLASDFLKSNPETLDKIVKEVYNALNIEYKPDTKGDMSGKND